MSAPTPTAARPVSGLSAIPLRELRPSPNNPRERLDDIGSLALSIREVGLIQPLVVQQIPGQGGYQVVAGHRRLAALQHLKAATALCMIRRDMLPDEELLAMLVENGQRAGLDPIEEARALQRLKRSGMTEKEIAAKVGRSAGTVRSRLDLLQLPIEEQEEVRAGHYSLQHAQRLVRDVRQANRRREKPEARPVGRPKGAKTKPHFGPSHPLADTVRRVCDHRGTPKVGGVGCGPCWEQVVRADAQAVVRQDGAA